MLYRQSLNIRPQQEEQDGASEASEVLPVHNLCPISCCVQDENGRKIIFELDIKLYSDPSLLVFHDSMFVEYTLLRIMGQLDQPSVSVELSVFELSFVNANASYRQSADPMVLLV